MDSAAESIFGSLHHRLVHRGVGVDGASNAVSIDTQYLSKCGLANHLRNIVAYEVCAKELLISIEDKLHEAIALASSSSLARCRVGELADLVLDALSLNLSLGKT